MYAAVDELFLIPYRLTGNTASVIKLMKKYADIPMDFADGCMVDIYRWGKNRPFELLINIAVT